MPALLGGSLIAVWLLRTLADVVHGRQDRGRLVARRVQPPPGWPVPVADWLPPVGWRREKSRSDTAGQDSYGGASHPAPPPRSVWEASSDAEMKVLYRVDATRTERQLAAPATREYLHKQARELCDAELRSLRDFNHDHAHLRCKRSRWHPHGWAEWRALNSAAGLASAIDGRLSRPGRLLWMHGEEAARLRLGGQAAQWMSAALYGVERC